jgi:hypothetical protein
LQISSSMKVKKKKNNNNKKNLFFKILKSRKFWIFKNSFVGFYLHDGTDLWFFSLQFVNFTICKSLTLKSCPKEINTIAGSGGWWEDAASPKKIYRLKKWCQKSEKIPKHFLSQQNFLKILGLFLKIFHLCSIPSQASTDSSVKQWVHELCSINDYI